jgi:hypothetical protein
MSDQPDLDPEAVLEQSRHDPLPCPIGLDDVPFICSAGVCDGLVCTQSRLFRAYVANESLRAERACLLAIKDAAIEVDAKLGIVFDNSAEGRLRAALASSPVLPDQGEGT